MITKHSTEIPLTCSAIRNGYTPDLVEHHAAAQALGLDCPLDVFEQLFHDPHGDGRLAEAVRFLDWRSVSWREDTLTGFALRRVGVPKRFQHAVEEARWLTTKEGFIDRRPDVMARWSENRTWMRAPVVVSGEGLQLLAEYGLLVGFTRLGNLLGSLDRQDLHEYSRHRVWLGH